MYHKVPADQVQIDFSSNESNVAFSCIAVHPFFSGLVVGLIVGAGIPAWPQSPDNVGKVKPIGEKAGQAGESLQKISNGQISVGIKPASGGAIAWVAREPTGKNLVNAHDHGRLIQQSYYGKADGSRWNQKPWHWNPVQGGDWRGNSARVLEQSIQKSSIYVKTLPKHWASGEDLSTTVMQQWIELDGAVAHIKYRFEQTGGEDHPARHQELPAVFVQAELRNLVLYDGLQPWTGGELTRSVPGWPNEYRQMTEHWAAYVNNEDEGIGVYVPVSSELTCYRFGSSEKAAGACSYFAPLRTFAIARDFVWEYDVFVTVGSLTEIRTRFASLHERYADKEFRP